MAVLWDEQLSGPEGRARVTCCGERGEERALAREEALRGCRLCGGMLE